MQVVTSIQFTDILWRVFSHFFPEVKCTIIPTGTVVDGQKVLVTFSSELVGEQPYEGVALEREGVMLSSHAQLFASMISGFLITEAKRNKRVFETGDYMVTYGSGTNYVELDDALVAAFLYLDNTTQINEQLFVPQALSVLRLLSSHRYEGRAPEISLLIDQDAANGTGKYIGHFGVPLASSCKAMLRLCGGGSAVYSVASTGHIQELIPLHEEHSDEFLLPRRLRPATKIAKERNQVCIALDESPSISILTGGICRFRFANGQWRWIDVEFAHQELSHISHARTIIQIACDLADSGSGGLIVMVDWTRDGEKLRKLVNSDCVPRLWHQWEIDTMPDPTRPQFMFYSWLHDHPWNIGKLPSQFLLNLLAVDGAVFLDAENGALLGYGAIVKADTASPDQGARTTATKFLSQEFGFAIKISADRNAMLYKRGRLVCRIW